MIYAVTDVDDALLYLLEAPEGSSRKIAEARLAWTQEHKKACSEGDGLRHDEAWQEWRSKVLLPRLAALGKPEDYVAKSVGGRVLEYVEI